MNIRARAAHLAAAVATTLFVSATIPAASAEDADNAVAGGIEQIPADATPEDIRQSLVAGGGSQVTVSDAQEGGLEFQGVPLEPIAVTTGLPDNTFEVRSYWASYYKNGYFHITFYGTWNFRDDFIGSGDPRDASAVAVQGFPATCWRMTYDSVVTKDYEGNSTAKRSRYGSTQQSSIFNIDDETSSFKLKTDNGVHAIDYKKTGSGSDCNRTKAGSYYFEHNQGGDGGWSASVSVGVFSISYNGSSGLTLRKASKYDYYDE